MTSPANSGLLQDGRATGTDHAEDHGRRVTSAVKAATGRERDEWFTLLDAWGAPDRPYREIAAWLGTDHAVTRWWAQKLVVEYEQERGLRAPGVRPDGTFTVTASKTVAVPVARLFEAFVDEQLRERWLPGVELSERTTQQGRSARFDVGDASRVNVTFTATGEGKSQAAVEHERLPDVAAAEQAKAAWRERLTALKDLLEG